MVRVGLLMVGLEAAPQGSPGALMAAASGLEDQEERRGRGWGAAGARGGGGALRVGWVGGWGAQGGGA